MTTFLALTVVGIVVGCIYALTATGLVVTYITSGIFNFAHGAVGMIAAFTYWELTVKHGWPVLPSLVLVILVLAPLMGAAIERLLMRKLHGAPTEVSLVITLGLLLFLLGVGFTRWDPGVPRLLPKFFAGHQVKVFSVVVTYHLIVVVLVAAAVAVGLRLFLFRTRSGIALRAVVDDPDLVALTGAAPARVSQLGWAIGSSLAALAGILLAPIVTPDILILTLLVVNGYAAAMVGRLRSLPLTFAGGVALGMFESYAVGYLPGSVLSQLRTTLPIIFLFIIILVLPASRLRVGQPASRPAAKVPSLRTSAIVAGVYVVGIWIVSGHLSLTDRGIVAKGAILSLVMLSLVLLTGYSGQISLAQMTFVGFGAFAMGKVAGGGSWWGVLAAIGFGAAAGALISLPALRLRGLYLALSTLAVARAMDTVFFNNNHVFGQGGAVHVGRVALPGISLDSPRAYLVFCALVFAVAAVGVVAVRRAALGRRLAAMSDSPAACATLGMSLTWNKLLVFSLSAAIASLGGVLYGGLSGSVGTNDFQWITSLVVLLLAVIWGVDSVLGVFFAGLVYAFFPTIQSHIHSIHNFQYLATGLGALALGNHPEGAIRQTSARIAELRSRRSARAAAPSEPAARAPAPARAVASELNGKRHTPALELLGIRAAYGRIEVVHGVDLVVPPSSVFALLGPNGAGKSTLLKVARCAMVPTAGHVHIAGVHVNGAPPEAIARIGVCTIPEGRGVFANLTVAENLRMLTYRDGLRPSEVEERAYARFPRLGERRGQLAGTLSGGEQQMLAMARAVATEPKLLLLDEISLGLAPLIVAELYELVGQLAAEGLAILCVEQFARTALAIADYAAVMVQGRIERVGQGADVADAVSAAYLGGVA
ncbi:MAG: ATP-binding cassette domain-containing protein [Actinobacteria bacterium]|nr:MAG: ATP-binding cassette domain-containing protein [Actinomycetota bacterium]